jgi:hypothetical protein
MSTTTALLENIPFDVTRLVSEDSQRVRNALVERGLETPIIETGLSRDQKYTRIVAAMTDVVTTLGLDLNDDSLQETPHRIAKMYVDELFSGLDYANFPKVSVIDNKMQVEEMRQRCATLGLRQGRTVEAKEWTGWHEEKFCRRRKLRMRFLARFEKEIPSLGHRRHKDGDIKLFMRCNEIDITKYE